MTAKVTIEQQATGWYVVVTDAENVVVKTEGPRITVASTPDTDDTPPLQVGLSSPVTNVSVS
jgi:hypothetical protein